MKKREKFVEELTLSKKPLVKLKLYIYWIIRDKEKKYSAKYYQPNPLANATTITSSKQNHLCFANAKLTALTVIYRKTLAQLIDLLHGISLMFNGYILWLGKHYYNLDEIWSG